MFLIFVMNLLFPCISKTLLIETKQLSVKNDSERITGDTIYDDIDKNILDNTANDYMADVEIKSAQIGESVELKCVSPKEFSRCFFSKVDEHLFYEIRPKVDFQNQRLQCLCDVSLQ